MKLLKKLASLAMSAVMLLSCVCFTAAMTEAAEVIPVYLNGKQLEFPANDAQPQIYQNRTYVPIRKTAEYLGLSINWNSKTETLTFSREGVTIDHTMRSNIVYVSGNPRTFDTRSINVQNRTLMPIRMLGESIGATVDWDNDKRAVYIKTADFNETTTEAATAAPVVSSGSAKIINASLNKSSIGAGETVKLTVTAKDATRVRLVDAQTQKEIEVISEYGESDDGTRVFEALLKGENDSKDSVVRTVMVLAGNDSSFNESLSETRTVSYVVTTDKSSDDDDDDDDDDEKETIKSDHLVSYKLDSTTYAEDDYANVTVVTDNEVSKVRITNSYSNGRTESSEYTEKSKERTFKLKPRLSQKGTVYLYITLYIEDEGYEAVQQKVKVTVGKTASSKKTHDELEIVDIDVLNDTVYVDEEAHVLVYTSTDVTEVSIYDEDDKKMATSYYYYSKEDGQLVWNLSFEVSSSGRQKYYAYAYNDDDEKVSEIFKLDGEKYSKNDAVVLSVDQRTSNVRDGDTCKFNVKCTSGIYKVILTDDRGRELGWESNSSKSGSNREFTVKGTISDVESDYYIYGYDDADFKASVYKFRVVGSSSGDLQIISVDLDSNKVDIDDDIELTVETSTNVERLVIVDQDDNRVYKKTKPTKEKDDVYIWEISFSPEEKGRNTFTITIEDEDDNTEEYDFNVQVTK